MIAKALLDGVLYSDRLLQVEIHASFIVTDTRQRRAGVPAATAAHDTCSIAKLQQLVKMVSQQHMDVTFSRQETQKSFTVKPVVMRIARSCSESETKSVCFVRKPRKDTQTEHHEQKGSMAAALYGLNWCGPPTRQAQQ